MYCPTCGSEERHLSQYCRACGVDLRGVRLSLERPDATTASAVSARDQIGRAFADKIRETRSVEDLKAITEEVLPEIEKFLESPAEKRLRRIRAGVIFAAMGLGATLISIILIMKEDDFLAVLLPSVVFVFIGLGVILNGILFTLPRKELADRSDAALAQMELDSVAGDSALSNPHLFSQPTTNELDRQQVSLRPSVTEHTTHQLKPNKS